MGDRQITASNQSSGEPIPAGGAGNGIFFLGEGLVAVSMALVSVQLSRSIEVNPLDRIGQVSGLAALDLRFLALGLLVLLATIVAANIGSPRVFALVCRFACAALAGLATGLVAGGLVVALRGTTWPLYADLGDAGTLATWAGSLAAGGSMPAEYPPLVVHLIAWWAQLTTDTAAGALRVLQIVGTALFGPVAYLSWRLLLPPVWALGIGLVPALPLIDLYKTYTNVVLVALLPITIMFLHLLRKSGTASWWRITLSGVGVGAVVGLLFLTYSGWFIWSAAGVFVALLIVFPWRTGFVRGTVLLGITAAVFLAVAGSYLFDLIGARGTARDTFFFFDVYVEPAYITMWRTDLPGDVGLWPPPGELAGVGLFTVLLVAGLGAAIALGGTSTVVLTLGGCLVSAWLMRFWLASQMYATQEVALYPRTTPEILYCLLLLSGFAVYFACQRFGRPFRSPGRSATVGALCAGLLLFLFAGSAVADRYLPRPDNSLGSLAYFAQMIRQQDGQCPAYSRTVGCASDAAELLEWLKNGRAPGTRPGETG